MQRTGNSGCFPCGKRAAIVRRYTVFYISSVQCFHVSIIHQTLTWTTGSLSCVRDHSFACICTRGLGTLTSQQNLTLKNSRKFLLCSEQGSNLWSLDLESMLYQLSHPIACTVHSEGRQTGFTNCFEVLVKVWIRHTQLTISFRRITKIKFTNCLESLEKVWSLDTELI